MSDKANVPIDFLAEEERPEFKALKAKRFSVVIPLTIAFLAWYFLYVILSTYAHDFMSTKVWGMINVGLILGLLQFVSTFVITMYYVWFANSKLDDSAAEIRERLERESEGAPS